MALWIINPVADALLWPPTPEQPKELSDRERRQFNRIVSKLLITKSENQMAVRAKVRCNAKTGGEVNFTTVYEPDASKDTENARFTTATPWGDIRLGINNPAALDQFEVNKEYYVDFHPAK